MGRRSRPKPKRLAEKLLHIRLALDLAKVDMLRRLGLEGTISDARISEYEAGLREPPLMTLLEYSRVGGVHMEALVDDEIDLPDKLPGPVKYEEIKSKYASRTRTKRR